MPRNDARPHPAPNSSASTRISRVRVTSGQRRSHLVARALCTFLVVSGRILELSASGGWRAKCQEVAQQNVSTTATPLADVAPLTQGLDQLQAVEKEGLPKLDEIVGKLQKGKPVALILYFGKQNYY